MLQKLFLTTVLVMHACGVMAAGANLYDVYEMALEADPRVKMAHFQVDVGKAQHDNAFGALLPQASLRTTYSDNEVEFISESINKQYTGKRYSLQVRQSLFNWQAWSGNARARQIVVQREAELMEMMNILLVDVSERYFQVLLANDDLNLSKAEEKLVNQQLREAEALYKRKLVNITDYLETQARADQIRTDLIEAENNAALTREALSELTGTIINDLAPIKKDFILPQLSKDMAYWTELALSNNPLLRSKHVAVLAAQEAVQEQKGGHYPTVDLVLSGQRSDVGYDNLPSPKRDIRYVGVDITVPMYSGGSTSARVREALSHYYIALEEEEATRRDVRKRTREAWLNTISSRKRIDSAALSVKSSTKSFEAMSKSFSYGTVTATDVLVALRRKILAERDFQNALYSYLTHWLTLKRESGSLQATDLRQLNNWFIADDF